MGQLQIHFISESNCKLLLHLKARFMPISESCSISLLWDNIFPPR